MTGQANKSLVLQSYRGDAVPAWITQCLGSVQGWAVANGHDYRLVGDEIFSRVPGWYREKAAGRLPVLTDYGRLVLIAEALEEGYEQVVWLDADTLVLDPAMQLEGDDSCAFGQEHWVQLDSPCRYRVVRNVHNAACWFRRGCPVLPFLQRTVLSIMQRVDPSHIAPQLVGPKLLSALHNIAGFTLLPQCGALSPPVLLDIARGGGEALDMQRRHQPVPPQCVNLCASLVDADIAMQALERLRQGVFVAGAGQLTR